MTLYWVRNITSNNPIALRYKSHHTNVNEAAREIFNGRHKAYFSTQTKKHDPKNDVLLFAEEEIVLRGFHHDELQEESEE